MYIFAAFTIRFADDIEEVVLTVLTTLIIV